jgi:hypothetical protein
MDINDLFDGIMKNIKQLADESAEQRLQEKNAGHRTRSGEWG